MGYTHYWHKCRDFTPDEWRNICADVTAVLERSTVPVCWEYDEPDRKPQIDASVIRFNGVGADGHETFYFARELESFTFCKTARKEYDSLVCAALIIAGKHAPDALQISSDGDAPDWQPGHQLVMQALGEGYSLPLAG